MITCCLGQRMSARLVGVSLLRFTPSDDFSTSYLFRPKLHSPNLCYFPSLTTQMSAGSAQTKSNWTNSSDFKIFGFGSFSVCANLTMFLSIAGIWSGFQSVFAGIPTSSSLSLRFYIILITLASYVIRSLFFLQIGLGDLTLGRCSQHRNIKLSHMNMGSDSGLSSSGTNSPAPSGTVHLLTSSKVVWRNITFLFCSRLYFIYILYRYLLIFIYSIYRYYIIM